MKIKILKVVSIEYVRHSAGDVVDVDDAIGHRFIAEGLAVECGASAAIETATVAPTFETAEAPVSRGRGRRR